tara:strand:- start:927 stop:1367 length:441 start_codon:yes stop_codon:yes gene_type:complete
MKVVAGFIAAVIVTYVLGALFISQGNISQVVAMGFDVSMGDRISAAIHDITHMYDLYLPLVTIGLLVAFLIAGLIIRFVPNLRMIGFLSAGVVGMIALHVIMKAVLGLSGIAPTRELVGLLAQGLAGGFGGWAYYAMTRKTASPTA